MGEIKKQIVWLSTNVMAYPFVKKDRVDYHELVKTVASDFGVEQPKVRTQTSFYVERAINEQVFVKMWDRLSPGRRQELLLKIDARKKIKDHAGIAALSGAAALGVLAATVYMTGFAFYATMSVVISSIAAWVGITLPFVAYMGTSALVAFLTGPFGLAIIAIAAVMGIAFLGRQNSEKLVVAVLQLHAVKVAALKAAGRKESDLFPTSGTL